MSIFDQIIIDFTLKLNPHIKYFAVYILTYNLSAVLHQEYSICIATLVGIPSNSPNSYSEILEMCLFNIIQI